ncbi:substrate-binding domain-containing protein [Streptomyces sp. NBC_01396]|uniref:substrate-binding domain-containing protein n=1 Tax=Streptomyces sp. NBC_01396 TaxID=2903852 RepID=UPI0032528D71
MRSLGLAEEIDIVSTGYTQRGGYDGARELLARPRRPMAVFAGADIVAMGVLEACAEAGLSVPGDISVAGYDNTTFASFGPIVLTSVDQAGRRSARTPRVSSSSGSPTGTRHRYRSRSLPRSSRVGAPPLLRGRPTTPGHLTSRVQPIG